MNDPTTAEIIAFPGHPRPTPLTQSTERLAAALSSLSSALRDQGDALQRWREALRTLSQSVNTVNSRLD